MSTGVIYLSYVPYGVSYLLNFIETYRNKNAGTLHQLIILFNGFKNENELKPFIKILDKKLNKNYQVLLSPEKFDIGCYFYAAKQLTTIDNICFLNTYSKPLHNNWLLHLCNALQQDNVGVVGCTAGWGAFGRDKGGARRFIRKILSKIIPNNKKNTLKTLSNRKGIRQSFFQRFFMYYARKINCYPVPSAHIRTNSFIIRRDLFISLDYRFPRPTWFFKWKDKKQETKFRTICFEHGTYCMTNQILNKGLKALVVDKNGVTYDKEQWKESKTFWNSEQENLLIQDNQTQNYQNDNSEYRALRRYSAWNER